VAAAAIPLTSWQTCVKLTTSRYNLTFDLRGQLCGLSYSLHIPSLNLVCLAIPNIWLIFGHSINRPGDLDLWPFDL